MARSPMVVLREEIGELRCMLADLQKMVALALPEDSERQLPQAAIAARYLRARHLAEMLGVSVATVWRMARENRLPAPRKLGGGVTVWDRAEVEEWLKNQVL
jgi:excisionase family DNA binding protein